MTTLRDRPSSLQRYEAPETRRYNEVQRVFDLNIHRLTENMTERRIRDWKVLCKEHMNTIISVINNSPVEEQFISELAPADADAPPTAENGDISMHL